MSYPPLNENSTRPYTDGGTVMVETHGATLEKILKPSKCRCVHRVETPHCWEMSDNSVTPKIYLGPDTLKLNSFSTIVL